jgi:D-amino-acid dehydrogenase
MARTDAIVLGAGIVGVSIALHLVKRGLSVALVDRRGPGEETSYGNAGVIEGNTLFPHAFPSGFGELLRIALKRAPEANYHLSYLPSVAPWLLAYRTNTNPENSIKFAEAMRPLYAHAVAEHEALMLEAGATRYLRKDGWMKVYRSRDAFDANARERDYAGKLGLACRALGVDGALALEPSLAPVFSHAVHWPSAASVSNPGAVVKAYAARFNALGGVTLEGDARTLHRNGANWRIDTEQGALDSKEVVVALGPWASDLLDPLGIKLPMKWKRGYHRHFKANGNAALTRPVVDVANGYCLAPMEQGIRLTTGAEFADRDAPPTPVQFDRLLPQAEGLFPLGEKLEAQPWMGSRPCFADSRPVIGRAPGQAGLWLAYGHAHWGLTLGPVTGRLVADLVTGEKPFIDPAPYAAERFQ